MKRLLTFSAVALLTLGFTCSAAKASMNELYCHVFPPSPIESLRDFDISSVVNALRQVKKECDNAFRNSGGSDEEKAAAYKPYEDEKAKQFQNVWNRRRDQYAQTRITVTKEVRVIADESENRTGYAVMRGREYHGGGAVRIDCPYAGLKPASTGCHGEIGRSGVGEYHTRFDNIENNGFTYTMMVEVAPKGSWFVCKFQADFAYTDAHLDALANRDLEVLKDRIMMAL